MIGNETMASVGKNIRTLRKRKGLTQTQLSCIEHGKKGLSMQSIIDVSYALDATCDDILKGPGQIPRNVMASPAVPEVSDSFLLELADFSRKLAENCPKVLEVYDER